MNQKLNQNSNDGLLGDFREINNSKEHEPIIKKHWCDKIIKK